MDLQRLTLLRHAIAQKNLEDRHGGSGSDLLPEARVELKLLIANLSKKGIRPTKIYCSPVPQAEQTASFLSGHYRIPLIQHSSLQPLHLGVLSGLSREEASLRFPQAASLMEGWRKGEIELHQLVIPGAEDFRAFYNRGERFLGSLGVWRGDYVVVGTRSIVILLVSILLCRSPTPGGGYREIPMENCCFLTFGKARDRFIFEPSASVIQTEALWALQTNGEAS